MAARPKRKDYPTHAAWVTATQNWQKTRPQRKNYKSHSEWVQAVDAFNKPSKNKKQEKQKNNLKVKVKSINKTDYNVATKSGQKAYEKTVNENKNKKKSSYTPLEDDNDLADRNDPKNKVFLSSSSGKIAKEKHAKIDKDKANKAGKEKAKGATTKGGPVKDGVKFARSKGDDLAGFRRGPGTGRKDTRITKHLKKSGFTEDRLARLRKKNAEFQAKKKAFRKNKRNKNKLKKNTMGG